MIGQLQQRVKFYAIILFIGSGSSLEFLKYISGITQTIKAEPKFHLDMKAQKAKHQIFISTRTYFKTTCKWLKLIVSLTAKFLNTRLRNLMAVDNSKNNLQPN